MARQSRSDWAGMPADLLVMVLLRLDQSSRAQAAGVCKVCCAAASRRHCRRRCGRLPPLEFPSVAPVLAPLNLIPPLVHLHPATSQLLRIELASCGASARPVATRRVFHPARGHPPLRAATPHLPGSVGADARGRNREHGHICARAIRRLPGRGAQGSIPSGASSSSLPSVSQLDFKPAASGRGAGSPAWSRCATCTCAARRAGCRCMATSAA